ncbi:hypothetical protein KAMFAM_109 [Bacillus phage Kamfam]|uniref:Baseplate protein n=3 Tax=Bastillevirus TaxID=1918010 RepID=A0A024B0X7_9CAUD|nr:hypothetical protein FP73_gp242 [Bacillus phage Hoody T]YP_009035623.1 baseplate protein [Bacillus phage Evoli]AMW61855.1 hypothetical protein DNAM5_111 [Bacillus phage Vinny]ASR79559.1 hypothetical protein OTK52_107 [Bacillus phage OTooleKemple52]AXQ67257.1 hypothetical protein KAMFAM_109 [Bacillus phage Kamfam]AZF89204.1 hypothetical protein Goe5_c00980 [Bacillus phage vB_BthM-Goe5]AHZ09826.1 baseplate protein [Bacillus phage Evoli]
MARSVAAKPNVLVRFVSGISPMPDGTIPFNLLNDAPLFQSRLYKPVFSLSSVAMIVLGKINQGLVETVDIDIDDNTIVKKVMNSDLATTNPRIYTLIVSTILESFAILYTIESESSDLQYLTKKDFKRIRENINYIADFLSTNRKYRGMIEEFRISNISLGYLENQVEYILTERAETL